HEWESTVGNRTAGNGCPCCANDKVVDSNCLATTYPALAGQWHSLRNGTLRPEDVTAGSDKRVWWKCRKAYDHEWDTTVSNRTTRGTGCPCCANLKVVKSNCLATTHPDLLNEWHPTKNGTLRPDDVTASSHKRVWWKCPKGPDHEWEATLLNRTKQKSPSG